MIVDFSGEMSFDEDGNIVEYIWDLGDGSQSFGIRTTHNYNKPGDYTVILTVKDDRGASSFASLKVKIEEKPWLTSIDVDARHESEIKNQVIDLENTNVKLYVNITNPVTVTILTYDGNPFSKSPLPKGSVGKYFDICISNPDAVDWPVKVEYHYNDTDVVGNFEDMLGLYWWDGLKWVMTKNTWIESNQNRIFALFEKSELSCRPLTIAFIKPVMYPAAFTYTNLSTWPTEIKPGESVTVIVNIANTGEMTGAYSTELKLDGRVEEMKVGTLTAGSRSTVNFNITSLQEGTHLIEVGGLINYFSVVAEYKPPPPPPSDWLIFVIISVQIFVIAVAGYFWMASMFVRKKGEAPPPPRKYT
jgi:PKD repeat protein